MDARDDSQCKDNNSYIVFTDDHTNRPINNEVGINNEVSLIFGVYNRIRDSCDKLMRHL